MITKTISNNRSDIVIRASNVSSRSVLNVKLREGSFAALLVLVSHLGHVGDGVGIVHQFPLVHFNFTQSAKYQIKNFVITTHDSV